MNTLNVLSWDTTPFLITALLSGIFIRTSLRKSSEYPLISLITVLITIAIMVILPYGIKEELFDKAVKVIGSFMAIPIIGIILGFVFLVKFFGTYHGAFGIFVFALPIGWLLGQSVITENFLAVILGLICFVIGVLVKFFLREKEKIANEI